MTHTIKQFAPGAATLLIGLAAAVASFQIGLDYDGSWGPRIFPLMSAGVLILLGALMLRSATSEPGNTSPQESVPRDPFILLGLVILYLWLIGKVGYLISTAMVTPATLWLFGIRNPLALAFSALAAPAIFHLIFFELLGVFPPYGAWFDLLDVIGG
ncbi:tripartite tricarboxylate transporter TctB family protein [Roseibium sediminis]|uniref:tripartite tricarboxylate transporter TctB family protein n=1 Tax=Roseibium sediminis TaxID=1775174 RepID=UPI00123D1B0E|nr:tripartite tricarboxylate transporter TctB family protein [Roseibium sediminis]